MSRNRLLMIMLFAVALPASLHAVPMGNMGGMGGMGGIGGMVEKISIQTKAVGSVNFSHSVHGANCNACHPKLFKKKSNSNHVGMKAMEKGQSCGACHDGKKAFSVTTNCSRCHAGDITIKTKTVGKVLFSHDVHVGAFGCEECHPGMFKPKNNSNHATMKAMADGASCGACHDGSTAFSVTGDCATCHAGDIIYKEKDAGNVTFPHAAHLDLFACDECHPDLFKAQRGANKATMEDMEQGASCGACHDGNTAFGVADDCEACHQM